MNYTDKELKLAKEWYKSAQLRSDIQADMYSFMEDMRCASWKKTKNIKPEYYKNVTIFSEGKILKNWHRLSNNGDDEYYGSLTTDEIIYSDKVSHWIETLEAPILI